MKRVLKIFCAVLALTLLIGVLPVFAADGQTQYLVLGDSVAAGDGLDDPDTQCYGALVANADGFVYTNDAKGGSTSADLIERLKDAAVAADVAGADIISISIGGNDFLLGNMPQLIINAVALGDYTMMDDINKQFGLNLAAIIEEIKALSPNALIVMQTLYNPRHDALGEIYQEAVNRINSTITGYLNDNPGSYVIADVAAAMADDETLIQSDGIHPNAAGHLVIANTILKLLFDLGCGAATETTAVVTPVPDPPVILLPALLFLIYYIISFLARL